MVKLLLWQGYRKYLRQCVRKSALGGLLLASTLECASIVNADDNFYTKTTTRDDVEVKTVGRLSPGGLSGSQITFFQMKKKGADSRLPVALIDMTLPETGDAWLQSGVLFDEFSQVKDFALRGYLAVGVPRGPDTAEFYGSKNQCDSDVVGELFDSKANMLEDVLNAVKSDASADPTRMIVVSNGVGAMDALALARRHIEGLKAVISISGGFVLKACDMSTLIPGILSSYGRETSSVPTLWLYSDNDASFPQETVRSMRDAYVAGGSKAELSFLHNEHDPGFYLAISKFGRLAFLPYVDEFLEKNALPSTREKDVEALAEKLGRSDSKVIAREYLSAPTNRALAISSSGQVTGFEFGSDSVKHAQEAALADCGVRSNGETCRLLMVNSDMFGSGN